VNGLASYRLSARVALAIYLSWNSALVNAAPLQTAQFVGAVGCKSSSCHGGAGEKRSQYLTWVQQDFHAKAYAILTNARSARIADTLSLSPAQMSARCTICHSPFQSVGSAHLASTAHIDEGVSCESCHNAAEPWLRGHTRKDWTYSMRVSAGMRDLRSFYVRANTCVACHQNIDSDMIKAGHPELTFELDGQSIAEPKHWRDDDSASGPRAWLVGQAVALRETSWMLANHDTPDAEATARWNGLSWLLAKATTLQPNLPMIEPPSATMNPALFAEAQKRADALARRASESRLSDDFARQLLRALAATDSEFAVSKETKDVLFCRAQRLVPALDRLSSAVSSRTSNVVKNPSLDRLFDDLKSRADFQAPTFAEHLASFRATIERAP
jgi:hypothetical protein